jgi:hypothetical protein
VIAFIADLEEEEEYGHFDYYTGGRIKGTSGPVWKSAPTSPPLCALYASEIYEFLLFFSFFTSSKTHNSFFFFFFLIIFSSTLFIFFLLGVKQKSEKFSVKNVRIHDMSQNELFFFSIFYPCQDAYFFTSTFFIFFLPGVKWESGKSNFSEGCTIFFPFFTPEKTHISSLQRFTFFSCQG